MSTRVFTGLLLGVSWLIGPLSHPALAAARTLKAGDVVGGGEDIVLSGDDVLRVEGTAEKPCRLDANTQQIRTADGWRGRIEVRHAEFRGLGSARTPALAVTATGDGDRVVIEHSSFHACGAI